MALPQTELRLLIIDDSPEDQELYIRLLQFGADSSHIIATAETGEEGLAKLQPDKIDCVLLDYNLPDMNGLEFLHHLSNRNGEAPTAVVMLTGQGNETIAVEAMKLGAQDYIVKSSLTSERLALSIQSAVEKLTLHHKLTIANEKIEQLAFYDPLTGVANRNLFHNRIERLIKLGKRSKEKFALLLLDMDEFKEVNDTMGHLAGDELLKKFSQRIMFCIRETDTIARLGGDEFAIVIENINILLTPEIVAGKILEQCADPIEVHGKKLKISCSIGISIFPDDAGNFEELLKNADVAMYRAKNEGRNGFRFFTSEMNAQVIRRKNFEMDLQRALDEEEFQVHYQPILDLKGMQLISAEALIRWPHPERGVVSPNDFIPIAEESRLIVPIGSWVFCSVCEQIKKWKETGLHLPRVALNLSSWQLRQDDCLDMVKKFLEKTDTDPEWLSLEITESVLMSDVDHGITTLESLREMGIQIVIDDFGTGYSSLGYLKTLPIDIIKIDRSFVEDIPTNFDDMAIAEAIIAMAHRLGLKVVAEGIETNQQLEFMQNSNCEFGQGYYFGKAMPEVEFEEFICCFQCGSYQ